MRPRPLDWFGPEDHDGLSEPANEIACRQSEQERWDAEYAAMPWWRRVLHHLFA